uniref:Uncharacterized protein n=1 Tax=Rhizophora mucronata TaxID=61149 RepID=A0A2P2QB28_RHIMU
MVHSTLQNSKKEYRR